MSKKRRKPSWYVVHCEIDDYDDEIWAFHSGPYED
jgi:hypothetical protein